MKEFWICGPFGAVSSLGARFFVVGRKWVIRGWLGRWYFDSSAYGIIATVVLGEVVYFTSGILISASRILSRTPDAIT